MEKIEILTEERLKSINNRWYGAGQELKVGDKIIFGFTTTYANINGTPPSEISPHEVSLAFQIFVISPKDGFIYQLYKKKDNSKPVPPLFKY